MKKWHDKKASAKISLPITSGPMVISRMPQPRVTIDPVAFSKILEFIAQFDLEIAGMGVVEEIVPGQHFHIRKVFLVDQDDNAGGHVDIKKGFDRLVDEMVARDEDPTPMRFWWHSHVNMEAFWSGTDEGTAVNWPGKYLISLVGNKRNEFRMRMDFYLPVVMTIDNIPLSVEVIVSEGIREQCKKEIATHVKTKNVFFSPTPGIWDYEGSSSGIRRPPLPTAYRPKGAEIDRMSVSGVPVRLEEPKEKPKSLLTRAVNFLRGDDDLELYDDPVVTTSTSSSVAAEPSPVRDDLVPDPNKPSLDVSEKKEAK